MFLSSNKKALSHTYTHVNKCNKVCKFIPPPLFQIYKELYYILIHESTSENSCMIINSSVKVLVEI